MKRKIISPDIAVKMSINAYLQAAKEFNQKQEELYQNGNRKELPATVKSLLLKETHHQVFYILINYYREKVVELNAFFQGSGNIMTHISPKMSMYVKTGRIAAHLNRTNNTIRERLRRLEKAGIIKVVFHGHKKPLEIIFEKNTCLVFDKSNRGTMPKSKYLNSSESVYSDINNKKPNNKESTFSGTFNNITITEDVLHEDLLSVAQKFNPMQHDFYHTENISKNTKNLTGTTETVQSEKKERKKVPAKKERKDRTVKEIRESKHQELKEKAKLKQMTDEERKQHSAEKKEKYKSDRSNELKKRKTEALIHYSLEFFAYLMSALFFDKYLTPHYRKDTLNYISKHYFAKAKSITEMENLLINYKKRVDISKEWIAKFQKGSDGSSFDTTYFFPKAYLDIEKTRKNQLSFANTKKFIKQEKDWDKINGYNRKTDKTLRHKLNKIAREIENGFIDYDTALERVKSLTDNSDEYVKQLNARYFGIYKTMQNS